MFVQVIKGRTKDIEGLTAQLKQWTDEVRPGAIGVLGGTSGIAEDGTVIVFARFEDEASARANADRPEQSAWWEATAPYFDGEPSFRESSDLKTLLAGGSDEAGFVQVMEGRITDREKAEAMETPELLEQLSKARPDLIGSVRVLFEDGTFAEAAYFTSEEEARKGEAKGDFSDLEADFGALFADIIFTDLKKPIFSGPPE